jgi:hypothetical protein
MITVVSYLKGIPIGNKNVGKPAALTNFINGVNLSGDRGILSNDMRLQNADVAVIQGYVHEDGKTAPHLIFRRQVLEHQKKTSGRTIIIDSNLFLYKDLTKDKGYLRLSYDGIFPNTGEYCYDNPDPARWEQIKRDIDMDLKPWRSNGKHILICLQRNGGWSMRGTDVVNFFRETVQKIRAYSSRPILVRTHPGDKKANIYVRELTGTNVKVSMNTTLLDDLKNAWATVVYNSSPSVASVIEGIPAFVLDPTHSQSAEVSNYDLSQIENPNLPDRLHWVRKLSQCHWTQEELANGTAWRHMKNWAKR